MHSSICFFDITYAEMKAVLGKHIIHMPKNDTPTLFSCRPDCEKIVKATVDHFLCNSQISRKHYHKGRAGQLPLLSLSVLTWVSLYSCLVSAGTL